MYYLYASCEAVWRSIGDKKIFYNTGFKLLGGCFCIERGWVATSNDPIKEGVGELVVLGYLKERNNLTNRLMRSKPGICLGNQIIYA